jgi:hypothetical protein
MSNQARIDIDHDDFLDLHDRLCFVLRDAGLRDHYLDVAIAAALQATVPIIAADREHRKRMSESLRVVN